MKERKYHKLARSYFNAKTGAMVGGLSSLVISTMVVATNPHLKEFPVEKKIQGVLCTTGLLALSYAISFDIGGKVANKIDNYFEKRGKG